MSTKSSSLKFFVTFTILCTFEYLNMKTEATHFLNIRHTHRLQSRSLLFLPTAPTRVQFIGGIGIPVEDLSFESVTSGYVLKAEYFLPDRVDAFRQKLKPQTIHRRRKSINESKSFNIKDDGIIDASLLNGMKDYIHDNQSLISLQKLKHDIHNNLVHQQMDDNWKNQQKYGSLYRWIVYKAIETILNRSTLSGNACMLRSICEHAAVPFNYEGGLLAEIVHIILTPSSSRDVYLQPANKNYLRAEILGHSGENCADAFSQCSKSPLEIISTVFEM